MKTLLIVGAIILVISFIIGIVLSIIIWKMNKEIDRLYSEIEGIKNYLVID